LVGREFGTEKLAVSLREELDTIRLGHTWHTMQESDVRSIGLCQIVKIDWSDTQRQANVASLREGDL
jgi:hypothetical protein